VTIRGTVPTTVERPSGLIRLISLPGPAPSWSASFDPIAIRPLPGVIDLKSPATTLDVSVLFDRISGRRMPRRITPSTRPLAEAISGCSTRGSADVTPGVLRAESAICCQLPRRPSKPWITAWPLRPTTLSNSSARKPFMTLITTISAMTPSATATTLNAAATKMNPSPFCGSK
jgi:hypothetical protein